MKKRKRLFLGIVISLVVVGVAAVFLDPTCVLWGYLRREAFYNGRPTTYWRKALSNKDPAVQANGFRALKEGGQSATGVLIALLGEKRGSGWEAAEIRWKAADLLGQLGPQAGDAAP